MNKKALKEFEFDIIGISDAFFQDEKNIKRMQKFNISREELIDCQRKELLSWLENANSLILSHSPTSDTFALDISCPIGSVYEPNEAYLTRIVEFLEFLLIDENCDYAKKAFLNDPADMYGASAHSSVMSYLALDNKYLFSYHPRDKKHIANSADRFAGLLPYLCYNNYKQLYERMFAICLIVMKRYSFRSGKMILAVLNFLKENDSKKYCIFKKEFDEIRKMDESVWNKPLLYGNYGNGFEIKKEYWDTPFMETIE